MSKSHSESHSENSIVVHGKKTFPTLLPFPSFQSLLLKKFFSYPRLFSLLIIILSFIFLPTKPSQARLKEIWGETFTPAQPLVKADLKTGVLDFDQKKDLNNGLNEIDPELGLEVMNLSQKTLETLYKSYVKNSEIIEEWKNGSLEGTS